MSDDGGNRRDEGMERAADAQDRDDPTWGDRAFQALVAIARRQNTVHVDDLLLAFRAQPRHPNAWGSVWMRAIRAGIIEHSGAVRHCTVHTHKHKHQYPVYRSLI